MYCSFINTELNQQLYNSCLNEMYLTRVSLVRHITAFLHLGTLDSTSAQYLMVILKSEIKRHKNVKNVALNFEKGTCLQ